MTLARFRFPAAAALLLAAHAILSLWAILRNSVTVDEVNHLPAGITYVQKGTFHVYRQNPPLAKMLYAPAALVAGARMDYDHAWRQAEEHAVPVNFTALGWDFQGANLAPAGHYQRIYIAARLVAVAITLAGGVLLFVWARALHGEKGGLLALALWAFSPTIIAHGGLVTTDVPAAVAGFAATFLFWRWSRRPSFAGALVVGAALGVAQLMKFSSLVLFFIWPVLGVAAALGGKRLEAAPGERRFLSSLVRGVAYGGAILAACLVVINAGYFFEGTGRKLGRYEFLSPHLTVPRTEGEAPYANLPYLHARYSERMNRFRGTPLAGIPVPLPSNYVQGLDDQLWETNTGIAGAGYPMYLHGDVSLEGWWYYYLYALALKVPLGTWLLFAAALLAAARSPRFRLPLRDEAFIWLPAAAMLGWMMSLTKIELGVRYVLPCFPFALLGISRLSLAMDRKAWRAIVVAGVASTALSAALIAPHFIAYFNVLAGGPRHGHKHLIDSNLDWGQDLLELKKVLDRRGHVGPLRAALFGNLDPIVVGIETSLIPRDPKTLSPSERDPEEPSRLEPGLHAVSVNYAMGMPYRWAFHGRLFKPRQGAYAYFQRLTPVARAGYSIWLYDLSEEDCARLNAELGLGG